MRENAAVEKTDMAREDRTHGNSLEKNIYPPLQTKFKMLNLVNIETEQII